MPIYTYRCPICGLEDEILQRTFSSPASVAWCADHKIEMERVFDHTNFKLKWVTKLNGKNHADPGPKPRGVGPAEITRMIKSA